MQAIDYKAVQNNIVVEKLSDLTFDGLERGYHPNRYSDGSSGASFMPDSSGQKYFFFFKTIIAEPML